MTKEQYEAALRSQKQLVSKYRNLYLDYKIKYEFAVGISNDCELEGVGDIEKQVIDILNDYYKVDISKHTKSRLVNLVTGRGIAMWYLITYFNMTLSEAGAVFGKDHATALHARRRIDTILEDVEHNPKLRAMYQNILIPLEHLNQGMRKYEEECKIKCDEQESNQGNPISVPVAESAAL